MTETNATRAAGSSAPAGSAIDTSCRKCGADMKPLPRRRETTPIGVAMARMTITGYRCDCGHWNSMKRRRPNTKEQAHGTH